MMMMMMMVMVFGMFIFVMVLNCVFQRLKLIAEDAGFDAVVIAELPISQKCTDLQFAAPVLVNINPILCLDFIPLHCGAAGSHPGGIHLLDCLFGSGIVRITAHKTCDDQTQQSQSAENRSRNDDVQLSSDRSVWL